MATAQQDNRRNKLQEVISQVMELTWTLYPPPRYHLTVKDVLDIQALEAQMDEYDAMLSKAQDPVQIAYINEQIEVVVSMIGMVERGQGFKCLG